MGTHYDNVIVFGPTGAVGSACALEASKRGAKVWLAMRDPSKAIPGIPSASDDGSSSKFERVKADLSDPASITSAIGLSHAKAAFLYIPHAAGGMAAAAKAMKDAGVEYVVLLSSFTIPEGADLRAITPEQLIPFMHAQAEMVLEDLGLAHTALRPGSFASNPFKMSMDKAKTPVEVNYYGEGKRTVDNIVPKDIGRVGGAVLVDRPENEKEIIYLYGPDLKSEKESSELIKQHYAKEVKVVPQTQEEWVEWRKARGMPMPLLEYFVKALNNDNAQLFSGDIPQRGAANIKKYTGYEPTTFEEFVKEQD